MARCKLHQIDRKLEPISYVILVIFFQSTGGYANRFKPLKSQPGCNKTFKIAWLHQANARAATARAYR